MLDSIQHLLNTSNRLTDMEFRMQLEAIAKAEGEKAEHDIATMINSPEISTQIRINVIRASGYLRSFHFLVPLKKAIEINDNVNVRREAIIAITKYNDRRALNILDSILKKVRDRNLQTAIETEISKIKQNNPILAMMPKFLVGGKNLKTFQIALQILKKIVNAEDVIIFTAYLTAEDPLVANGAYQMLCEKGNSAIADAVFDFFSNHRMLLAGQKQTNSDQEYQLFFFLDKYLQRLPDVLSKKTAELQKYLEQATDTRIREVILNLLSSCPDTDCFAFVTGIYRQDESLRPAIIPNLAKHELGITFLLHEYEKPNAPKKEMITALLNTERGVQFLVNIFPNTDTETQQYILSLITPELYPQFRQLMFRWFESGDFMTKKIALEKIVEFADYTVEDILFTPTKEKEFFQMGEPYFKAIGKLFPFKTFYMFSDKLASNESLQGHIRRQINVLVPIVTSEPIVLIKDKEAFQRFIQLLLAMNNRTINLFILRMLQKLKTFDSNTYWVFNGALKTYIDNREKQMLPEERSEIHKIKQNLLNIAEDIRKTDEGYQEIMAFSSKKEIDPQVFEKLITSHAIAVYHKRSEVITRVQQFLMGQQTPERDAVLKTILRSSILASYFKNEIYSVLAKGNLSLSEKQQNVIRTIPQRLRFSLIFSERIWIPFFKDQCEILMPDFEICEDDNLLPGDILICDSSSLKKLMRNQQATAGKTYVILDELADFEAIKSISPVSFPAPASLSRIFKVILKELFN